MSRGRERFKNEGNTNEESVDVGKGVDVAKGAGIVHHYAIFVFHFINNFCSLNLAILARITY